MIRSIDAHLALKKLRESVPEVNAPEDGDAHSASILLITKVVTSGATQSWLSDDAPHPVISGVPASK